jgi:hypothetical protein
MWDLESKYMESINVFTDANTHNIGFIVDGEEGDGAGKKEAKYDSVTLNELDAIRYAAKNVKKMFEKDKFPSSIDDITFYSDNIDAIRAVQSCILATNCLPPDKDRIDIRSKEVKDILYKIEDHFGTIVDDYGMTLTIVYVPAHAINYKEAKDRFKRNNCKDLVSEFKEMKKSNKKKYIKQLMLGNDMVDRYIKER